MLSEKLNSYMSVISFDSFSLLPEYFLSISSLYILIVLVTIIYNVSGLSIQKALSECFGLVLLMTCYLIINDDILLKGFLSINLSFINDSLSVFSKFVICLFSGVFFFVIADFLKENKLVQFEYLLILLLAVLGLILLCSSNDFLTAYLAIELTSLSSYLLASFRKTSSYSVEAGIKYFIVGSVSSAFFLLGVSFLYAYTGSIYFSDFWDLFPSIDLSSTMSIKYNDSNDYYLKVLSRFFGDVSNNILELPFNPDLYSVEELDIIAQYSSWILNYGNEWATVAGKLILEKNNLPDLLNPSAFINYSSLEYYDKVVYILTGPVSLNLSEIEKTLPNLNDRNQVDTLAQWISWSYMYGSDWVTIVGPKLLASANLPDYFLSDTVSYVNYDSVNLLKVGVAFILFSLFIKLALAPFHLWSLDVYEGSPTPSAFFFAVLTKLSLFIFLVRFCYLAVFSLHEDWQFYMLGVAVFSVFVGSFGGLKQRKLKTLLAYSSVSHMGYGLLAFSNVSFFGVRVLLFYLFIYMLAGFCTWFIILLLRLKTSKISPKYNKELTDMAMLNKSNPALALGLATVMFSIAGLPPLIGFLAKIGVFLSLLREHYYFICIVAILCSVVSTFYYIRIIKILYFENLLVGKLYYPIKTNKVVILSAILVSQVLLFLNPNILLLILHNVVFDTLSYDFSYFLIVN